MQLDHIAISGETLAQATAYVEARLEVCLQEGGTHDLFQTHNRLLGLEAGLYLEALAVLPQAAALDGPRMFGIDRFRGPARLTNWICRCDDLDETLSGLPAGFGKAVEVARGDLRWRMAVPDAGFLPFDNCAPAFIQWLGDKRPAPMLKPSGCCLSLLEVSHPQAAELAQMLAPLKHDKRIVFTPGQAGLRAQFETPKGAVSLK